MARETRLGRWATAPLALLLALLLAAGGIMGAPRKALAATNAYTVKFAANGGTGTMGSQAIARDKYVALKANAYKRTAYVFTGWNTKKDGTGKTYADKAKVKNLAAAGKTVTLYAQWRKAKTYSVKFAANGGTGSMAAQKITYNKQTALSANAFTRTRYAFAGWNTKKDGTGKAYANKAKVTNLVAEGKTVTLYAQWRPTAYRVTFDANGADGASVTQWLTAGKVGKLRACGFSRASYRFGEWNTEPDGSGDAYDDREVLVEDLAPAGGSITLYAQWEPTAYTLAFDANGGTGSMSARSVACGRAYRLPMSGFSRDGYAFDGWATEVDGSGECFADRDILVDDLATPGARAVLYAQWEKAEPAPEPETYTIAFDPNGGTGSASQVVRVGTAFRLIKCSLEREGYEFVGWSTKPDGSGDGFRDREAILPGELVPVEGEVTLYAQWRAVPQEVVPATFTVTYDANGGTGAPSAQTATVGKAFKLARGAATLTREGYEFAGWNTASDGTGNPYVDGEVVLDDFSSDVILYAQWREVTQEPEPQTYHVLFDANGGEGEMAAKAVTEGASFRLPTCTITREGYEFAGWSTRSDGSGDVFRDREAVLPGDFTFVEGEVTLYAQWRTVAQGTEPQTSTCTITFDPNGGEGEMPPQTASDNKTYRLNKATFSLPDHEFAGWNTAADGSGLEYRDHDVIDADLYALGEVTLYAQWKLLARRIIFDPNGGTGERQAVTDYIWDSEYNESTFPFSAMSFGFEKERCAFLGWTDEPDAENPRLIQRWSPSYVIDCFFSGGLVWDNDNAGEYDVAPRLGDVRWDDGKPFAPQLGETITLYAVWSEARTIHFDANGRDGAAMPADIVQCAELPVYLPGTYASMDGYYRFTDGDYVIDYWSLTPDGSDRVNDRKSWSFDEFSPDAGTSVTLYAHWKRNRITVHFDANGGEGEMEDQVLIDYCEWLDNRGFRRSGYEFYGWNTEPDGSGVGGNHFSVDSLLPYEVDGAVTLYAQWQAPNEDWSEGW